MEAIDWFKACSIRKHPCREGVARIMSAAIQAVDPQIAVRDHFRLEGETLFIDDETVDLSRINQVILVGAGKAGEPMAEGVAEVLGDRLTGGKVILKDGYTKSHRYTQRVSFSEAAHPVPDLRGVNATREIIEWLKRTGPDDLVLCLISGGGSALMTSPPTGITLQSLQALTDLLLASGATIHEINALRKHLDTVKGGQLARYAARANKICSLILSDVVGDSLDVIASGPTAPDPTTYGDALSILSRYTLLDKTPASIIEYLQRGKAGELEETPKLGDPLFEKVSNHVIASNRTAANAAVNQARIEGFNAIVLTNFLQGEASQAGKFLAALHRQLALHDQPLPRPACVVIGGETTVTLRGNGLGGRNQELALSATSDLTGLADILLITLATDGGDGPTDAAGAVVSGGTLRKAERMGISPANFLERNDSYHFFERLGDLIIIGPTRTNVNDLNFLFTFKAE
jgi:hydroxypyruvate reductase